MRISDWSSDVCSSDLPPPANLRHLVARTTTERRTFDVGQPTPPTHPTQRHPGRTCDNSSPERRQNVAGWRGCSALLCSVLLGAEGGEEDYVTDRGGVGQEHHEAVPAEPGRAACWERVWQYV